MKIQPVWRPLSSRSSAQAAVPEYAGNRVPGDFKRWSDASRIDVTIVRSPLGVAETGSVLLSEEEFGVNTIGFLAHDIVILLDPAEIVENIHDAYGHPRSDHICRAL